VVVDEFDCGPWGCAGWGGEWEWEWEAGEGEDGEEEEVGFVYFEVWWEWGECAAYADEECSAYACGECECECGCYAYGERAADAYGELCGLGIGIGHWGVDDAACCGGEWACAVEFGDGVFGEWVGWG